MGFAAGFLRCLAEPEIKTAGEAEGGNTGNTSQHMKKEGCNFLATKL